MRTDAGMGLRLGMALLCGWLAASGTPPAGAALMEPATIEDLAQRADLVLHGIVRSRACQRDDRIGLITRVELDVRDAWKGDPGGHPFWIVLAGGTLGEETLTVPGQAEYQPGEEVVVFLRRNVRGEGVTVGLAQGKFEVHRAADGSEPRVQSLFHGDPPSGRDSVIPTTSPSARPPLTLQRLRAQVERTLR